MNWFNILFVVMYSLGAIDVRKVGMHEQHCNKNELNFIIDPKV